MKLYKEEVNSMVRDFHKQAREMGWWLAPEWFLHDDNRAAGSHDYHHIAAKLLLIHSEISEAVKGHRQDLKDDKLPHRDMLEVELADAVIRIFDLAGALGCDLGGAIDEKMIYNRSRVDHQLTERAKSGGKKY